MRYRNWTLYIGHNRSDDCDRRNPIWHPRATNFCFGPLDLLGTIGRDHDYSDLVSSSLELIVEDGFAVKVLDLETLITIKEETAGEKDRASLPLLRRTLEERRAK